MSKYTTVPLQRTIPYSTISMKKYITKNRNTVLLVSDVECAQMGTKKRTKISLP